MKEYQKQLDFYSDPDTFITTCSYLEKYWLFNNELQNYWMKILHNIYDTTVNKFPGLMFQNEYAFIPLMGGSFFNREDYNTLKKTFKFLGDKYFVIIQNYNEEEPLINADNEGNEYIYPTFNFKYPTDLSWEELMNGGYMTREFFGMLHNDYFVFSESGKFGLYITNDYDHPFLLIGFKKEYSTFFINNYFPTRDDIDYIEKWLPIMYKEKYREFCSRVSINIFIK